MTNRWGDLKTWNMPHAAPHERLVGALMASDSSAHVLTEALRAMVEAWFLLAQIAPSGSLLERSEQAVEVLEQGIADLRYALNLSPEQCERWDREGGYCIEGADCTCGRG